MADPITRLQLENASVDSQHIDNVANGSATSGPDGDGVWPSRLGENHKTLSRLQHDVESITTDAEAAAEAAEEARDEAVAATATKLDKISDEELIFRQPNGNMSLRIIPGFTDRTAFFSGYDLNEDIIYTIGLGIYADAQKNIVFAGQNGWAFNLAANTRYDGTEIGTLFTIRDTSIDQVRRPAKFGAVGYTTTNASGTDQAVPLRNMVQNADYGQSVYLDKSYISSDPTLYNPKATRITDGPGEIVRPIGSDEHALESGFTLMNWWQPDKLIHFNREFFYPLQEMMKQSDPANRVFKPLIVGDSTFANPSGILPAGSVNSPEIALSRIFENLGIPIKVEGLNIAKAGTTFEEGWAGNTSDGTSIPARLASGNFNGLVLKYGLNEALGAAKAARPASTIARVASQENVWRGLLSYIRTTLGLTYDKFPIIIMGPNAADHVGYNDQHWLRKWMPVERQIAHEYDCIYYDTFLPFQNAQKGATGTNGTKWLWTDGKYKNTGSEGSPVYVAAYGPLHPTDIGWAAIWNDFEDFVRLAMRSGSLVTNRVTNVPGFVRRPNFSDLPSSYNFGPSKFDVRVNEGWPVTGSMAVMKWADGHVIQTIYVPGSTGYQVRVKATGSDSWMTFDVNNTDSTITTSVTIAGATGEIPGYTASVKWKMRSGKWVEGKLTVNITDIGARSSDPYIYAVLPWSFDDYTPVTGLIQNTSRALHALTNGPSSSALIVRTMDGGSFVNQPYIFNISGQTV